MGATSYTYLPPSLAQIVYYTRRLADCEYQQAAGSHLDPAFGSCGWAWRNASCLSTGRKRQGPTHLLRASIRHLLCSNKRHRKEDFLRADSHCLKAAQTSLGLGCGRAARARADHIAGSSMWTHIDGRLKE